MSTGKQAHGPSVKFGSSQYRRLTPEEKAERALDEMDAQRERMDRSAIHSFPSLRGTRFTTDDRTDEPVYFERRQ